LGWPADRSTRRRRMRCPRSRAGPGRRTAGT
jgi:hypothetical protein